MGNMLNETTLIREHLKHLGEPGSVLVRSAEVLELAAHNSVGLGEVLQDYAHQSSGQLQDILRLARRVEDYNCTADDFDILRNIQLILKSAKTVLQMTPAAMQRNKAAMLGDQKFSRADVLAMSEAFNHDIHITWLLQTEDAGTKLVNAMGGSEPAQIMISPEYVQVFSDGARSS